MSIATEGTAYTAGTPEEVSVDSTGSVDVTSGTVDRSSSSSAPPVLELSTDSLFAWNTFHAHIFSDIRASPEYYPFYSVYSKEKKLPPPLEGSFLYEDEETDYLKSGLGEVGELQLQINGNFLFLESIRSKSK
jgi:hypothetical protein